MDFFDVWNEAYNILADEGERAMKAFLIEQVNAGSITRDDADSIIIDVTKTFNL